ncbi:hypothetical protein C5748_01410 [Phyllobacterium phragmitis]|uniref:CAAX prenyl protease 2/Lysostaphin resistance protein A-like domain-containing protein n=1 Tax=Phyllobacterium phragmitis TaxID=2670329 RepID=A0A2S9IZ72_9HYPH|nr:CPBP family intramembrane glutamic endopeptidase [Phyllobacterium phragmitis]PRD45827.1 hypothetical protein C5748_01410 [Phyllobacterium phragmitis]
MPIDNAIQGMSVRLNKELDRAYFPLKTFAFLRFMMSALWSNPLSAIAYLLLAIAIVAMLFRAKNIPLAAAIVSLIAALLAGILSWTGAAALAVFSALCIWHFSLWKNFTSSTFPYALVFSGVLVLLATVAFAGHIVPGFANVKILDHIRVSPVSAPFTMYLNYDKVFSAFVLASCGRLFWAGSPISIKPPVGRARATGIGALVLGACLLVIIPISMVAGYIAFEPKVMPVLWLWALNNFLFVTFAEEVLFRGMVQGSFSRAFARFGWSPYIALAISAGLFGLYHLEGGWSYVALATLAGLFYGTAYMKTGRIEVAMSVHFLLNLVHVLLFTYPRLA